jgi:cytochrome P450
MAMLGTWPLGSRKLQYLTCIRVPSHHVHRPIAANDRLLDYVLEQIWREQGSPDYLFLDVRPTQYYPLLLITSHELAEQISKSTKQQPYSVTKSPTAQAQLGAIIGEHSMLTEHGESWKGLRKRFNPAFAPQHLKSMLPAMFDKTAIFMEKLDGLAESGAVAEMEVLCTNITFDIIGQVMLNVDFRAQADTADEEDETFKHFRALMSTYAKDDGVYPVYLDLPLQIKRRIHSRRFNAAVKSCVRNRFERTKAARAAGTEDSKDRSVLALALQDTDVLSPHVLQATADQLKTFIFAGHDTTSILLQRLFYALSIHPRCLAKIRAEHDAVFGACEPRDVFVAQPDETIKALAYTSACIKEALRLWPPAATARMSHNGFKMRTAEGDDVCVDGCILYIVHHIVQRDTKVYGPNADDFVPERWTDDVYTGTAHDDETDSAETDKVPKGAWRPFERGPRNCIGQELANLEARVVLACVMRRYDFVKVGTGEIEMDDKGQAVLDDKGKCKTKSELLSVSRWKEHRVVLYWENGADAKQRLVITPKPIDRMRMKVKVREG